MIIRIIIIATAFSVLIYSLWGRKTHIGRAWKKIGLLLLVIAMVVAVLFPSSTNSIAHFVGVGRGADLLLYLLTLAFIMFALNVYVRDQDDRDALHRLARKVAILDAEKRYQDRMK